MTNSEQAKNGFKTFIVTFGISLLVFGFFYYLLSGSPVENVSIEDEATATSYVKKSDSASKPAAVAANTQEDTARNSDRSGPAANQYTVQLPSTEGQVAGVSDEKSESSSPFGELVKTKPAVESPTVLAGADAVETTQSTTPVPETGDFTMTLALLTSISLLGFFGYILFLNPRKYALSRFERDVIDEL